VTLVDNVGALATRIATEFKSVRAALTGKADDSAVVHNTGTETIGGAKTFSVAPQVPVGSLLAHPVRRDDARLADARTPTAHASSHASAGSDPLAAADIGAAASVHTHDATDITAGTLSALRLPPRPFGTATQTTTGTGSYNLDLSGAGFQLPLRFKVIANHNTGMNVPTNPTGDGQTVRVTCYANTAQRTFTFAAGFDLSTGITSRTVTIPSGQQMFALIEYSSDMAAWVITACTVSTT
jgi:hypothetical protein